MEKDETKEKREKIVQGIKNFFTEKKEDLFNKENESDLKEKRKKLISFIKEKKTWLIYLLLAVIIGFGVYLRVQNFWLLKDVVNGSWVSVDLDSHIYLKYAKYILQHGFLPSVDTTRLVPIGASTTNYAFTAYFLVYLYKTLHLFSSSITIDYVDVIYPLIAFAIGILFFFLLAKRLFNTQVALLSSLLLTTIPAYLQRTMGGSSDHDVLGIMFLFMALYFFIVAWQSQTLWKALGWGALAGLASGLCGLTWGAWQFLFLIFGLFVFLEFILKKIETRQIYLYILWLVVFILVMTSWVPMFTLKSLIMSLTTGIALFVLLILIVDLLLFKYSWGKKIEEKIKGKLPSNLTSILAGIVLGILAISVILGPVQLVNEVNHAKALLLHPMGKDRWELTVAEQHQPFFNEVISYFGPSFGLSFGLSFFTFNLSLFLFLLGLTFLFYAMVKHMKQRKTLTFIYLLSMIAIMFSRYGTGSFDGKTFFSKFIYFGGFALLFLGLFYFYLKSFYKDQETFKQFSFWNSGYLFAFVWVLFMIIAARGAIRLVFIFTPIVVLIAAYCIVKLVALILPEEEKQNYFYAIFVFLSIFMISAISSNIKIIIFGISILILILLKIKKPITIACVFLLLFILLSPLASPLNGIIPSFAGYSLKQAKYSGPPYDQQWQIAGAWVRENIPQNAVFGHWWDYGYWVQNGWERASVLDGANKVKYWNYLMGRHVLTGQNQTEALEFLYAHNTTHYLIVVAEIGKYTAYSSIGSDKNYDRYSWITTFQMNPKATQETRNETIFVYQGGFALDEDFVWQGNVYPMGSTGLGAVFLPVKEKTETVGNETKVSLEIKQPSVALVYQGKRIDVPLTCVYFNNKIYKFDQPGLNGCFRIIPTLTNQGQLDNFLGAGLLISEKGVKALWVNLYLFEQKNPDFDTSAFKKVYSDKYISQVALVGGRLMGPIGIWEIQYPKGFTVSPELEKLYLGGNENLPDYFTQVN